MIILDKHQGTEEWLEARRGIVTATGIKRFMNNRGDYSYTAAKDYIAELINEKLGCEFEEINSKDINRGNELEPEARIEFAVEKEVIIEQVGGVFLNDKKQVMISPDGLIRGQKKGVEIKCLNRKNHIKCIMNNKVMPEHYLQIMSSLWVTGYDSWYFVSYNNELENNNLFYVEVIRDDYIIDKIAKNTNRLLEELNLHKAKFGV